MALYYTVAAGDFGPSGATLAGVGVTPPAGTRRTFGVENMGAGRYEALVGFDAAGAAAWDHSAPSPVAPDSTLDPAETLGWGPDLVEALTARLTRAPALAAALPGGVRHGGFPPVPTYPSGAFVVDGPRDGEARDSLTATVTVEAAGVTYTDAFGAGDTLARYLLSPAARVRIAFKYGGAFFLEDGAKRNGAHGVRESYRAFDSRTLWVYSSRIDFWFTSPPDQRREF